MPGLADLFNLSLSTLGIADVVDDPDANTHTAKTLKRFWPTARMLTIRDFPWACVRKTRALALRNQDVPGWTYTYDYPSDCLFALALMPSTGLRATRLWSDCWDNHVAQRPQRFSFDRMLNDAGTGQVIVTDLAEAYVLQLTNVANPAAYDIGLFSAIAAHLAVLSAATFKVKVEFVNAASQKYEIERARAAANDLNEGYPDPEPETPSIAARG